MRLPISNTRYVFGPCLEYHLQTREALRSKIVTVESESGGDGDEDDSGGGGGGGGGDDGNEENGGGGGGRVKKVVLPVTYDITALQL